MQKEKKTYGMALAAGIFMLAMMLLVAVYERDLSLFLFLESAVVISLLVGLYKRSLISVLFLCVYFLTFRIFFSISAQVFGAYLNVFLLLCFLSPLWQEFRARKLASKEFCCAK